MWQTGAGQWGLPVRDQSGSADDVRQQPPAAAPQGHLILDRQTDRRMMGMWRCENLVDIKTTCQGIRDSRLLGAPRPDMTSGYLWSGSKTIWDDLIRLRELWQPLHYLISCDKLSELRHDLVSFYLSMYDNMWRRNSDVSSHREPVCRIPVISDRTVVSKLEKYFAYK